MKFEYGIINNKINITHIVLSKCVKNNSINIPKGDLNRLKIIGTDPCKNIVKNIYINGVCFNQNQEININLNTKICICFYGLSRSLKYTINSIRENIFRQLINNKYYFDVYFHTYNLDQINNKRSGENNIKLDNNEFKILNSDYIKVDNQSNFDETININNYLKQGDPWPENPKVSLLNLLRQLNSLKEVNKLSNNKSYSYYLYLRPDLKYINAFDCSIITNCKENEFYTPAWGKYGGLNDRMGFGTYNVMNMFSTRLNKALLYSNSKKLHSESFLKYIMQSYIIKNINMRANRERANGKESNDS